MAGKIEDTVCCLYCPGSFPMSVHRQHIKDGYLASIPTCDSCLVSLKRDAYPNGRLRLPIIAYQYGLKKPIQRLAPR